jgi:hypothetical protein
MGHSAVSLTQEALEAAERQGLERRSAGPTIQSAWYDSDRRLLLSQMIDGIVVGVPIDRFSSLGSRDDASLRRLHVAPSGLLVLWEDPDADVSIEQILGHAFGGPCMLREMARAAGRVRSEAKARAARANGGKGGRPRKSPAE